MKHQNELTAQHSLCICMLTMIFLFIGSVVSEAQNNLLVATLTHNGNVTAFYGSDALSQAHSAAESGDIITLSPGSFTAIEITKGVTIRGAGDDTQQYDKLTRINDGTFTINVDSTAGELKVENICFESEISSKKMSDGHFSCCTMYDLGLTSTNGVIFERCVLLGETIIRDDCNDSFISCVFNALYSYYSGDYAPVWVNNCSFFNCIIGTIYDDQSDGSFITVYELKKQFFFELHIC